jgi:RNase P protein component
VAPALPPEFVAQLLRGRPGAVGENFVMHWKSLPPMSVPGADASGTSAGILFLAVPKRQLARAVDRNLVRRIAREAWRAAGLARRPVAVLVKLRRRPDWFAQAGVRRRRAGLREELDALLANYLQRQYPGRQSQLPISDTLRRGS